MVDPKGIEPLLRGLSETNYFLASTNPCSATELQAQDEWCIAVTVRATWGLHHGV